MTALPRPDRPCLIADREGATAMLFGAALMALLGVAALAIDLASLYLAERRLQGIADAAAMAAAVQSDAAAGRGAAQRLLARRNERDVSIMAFQRGLYRQDKTIAPSTRFVEDARGNAARIRLRQSVPLFFARAFGETQAAVEATATASRTDMAAFSLTTALAQASGGIHNTLLSALAGTEFGLTVADDRALASARIDLLGYADALKAQVSPRSGTYADVFDRHIPLNVAIEAIAQASRDPVAAAVLRGIARDAGGDDVRLADLVDLGPLGRTDYRTGATPLSVDAYTLLRTLLERSHGDSYDIGFDLAVPGVSRASARLIGGRSATSSPWLMVTSAKDVVVRTAQSRLVLTADVLSGTPALATVKLPIVLELAAAEARLTDMACSGDAGRDGVTLAVTPSVGSIMVTAVDAGRIGDLHTPVTAAPATIAKTLLASVTGQSKIALGGTRAQQVRFSPAEINAGTIKTVGTQDVAQGVVASLIRTMTLNVKALGLGVNASILAQTVGTTLTPVAPALDAAVVQLTQALGVRIGAADVRVDRMRCGIPSLVA